MTDNGKNLGDRAGGIVALIFLACLAILAISATIRGVMYIFTGH